MCFRPTTQTTTIARRWSGELNVVPACRRTFSTGRVRKNMKTMRIRIKARSGDVLFPHRIEVAKKTEQVLCVVLAVEKWTGFVAMLSKLKQQTGSR